MAAPRCPGRKQATCRACAFHSVTFSVCIALGVVCRRRQGARGAHGQGAGVTGRPRGDTSGHGVRHGLHTLPARHKPVCVRVAVNSQPRIVARQVVRSVNHHWSHIENLRLLPRPCRESEAAASHCRHLREEQDCTHGDNRPQEKKGYNLRMKGFDIGLFLMSAVHMNFHMCPILLRPHRSAAQQSALPCRCLARRSPNLEPICCVWHGEFAVSRASCMSSCHLARTCMQCVHACRVTASR